MPVPLRTLVHDLVRLEGVALLPRTVHGDVIAGAGSPDVHRALLVHVADVDLHRQAGGVVAQVEIAVVLMEPDDGPAHPSALAVWHAAVRRIARVRGLAGEGDEVAVDHVAVDDAAEAD